MCKKLYGLHACFMLGVDKVNLMFTSCNLISSAAPLF